MKNYEPSNKCNELIEKYFNRTGSPECSCCNEARESLTQLDQHHTEELERLDNEWLKDSDADGIKLAEKDKEIESLQQEIEESKLFIYRNLLGRFTVELDNYCENKIKELKDKS